MVEDLNTVKGKGLVEPKFRRISSANKGNSHLIERRYQHARRTINARKDRQETQSAVASILGMNVNTLQENNNVNNIRSNKQSMDDKKKKKHGQITLLEESTENKSPKSKSTVQAIGLGRHRSFTRRLKIEKKSDNKAQENDEKSLSKSEDSHLSSVDESKQENSTNHFQVVDENNKNSDSILGIECLPTFLTKSFYP